MKDYSEIIAVVQEITARRDPYNHHLSRTGHLAEKMADAMGMSAHEKQLFVVGANLHDIGKILISENVLNQPRKLSPAEFSIVKQHAVQGYKVALKLDYDRLICDVILHHHENVNGTGYPDRLQGDQISIYAQAMRVLDVWDAMTSKRSYRQAMPDYEVVRQMLMERGVTLNTELVDLFFAKVYGHE